MCIRDRADLVKLDILINKEEVDALSFIVHSSTAYERCLLYTSLDCGLNLRLDSLISGCSSLGNLNSLLCRFNVSQSVHLQTMF